MTIIMVVFLSACNMQKKEENTNSNGVSNLISNTTSNIKENTTNDINVVASLEDTITKDTSWCATFNIVWNEFKDNYIKQDIIVNPKKDIVENLNKGTFNKKYLNENSYYVKFGKQTLALKHEIEENIKKKFNQTSDILDKFEWKEYTDTDFIYSMLYKKFTFKDPFKQLKNKPFNSDGDYRYFGIDDNNKNGINQVEVLYYDDTNNYAVKLITNENDEIILLKNNNNMNNFLDIYNSIINKNKNYKGSKKLGNDDKLLVPYIDFNTYKEFSELTGLNIPSKDGYTYRINKAVQTIKMQLNESGGDIKSEAAMSVTKNSLPMVDNNIRNFEFDSTFTIFLKEKNMDLPYFAAYIDNLSLFQKKDN